MKNRPTFEELWTPPKGGDVALARARRNGGQRSAVQLYRVEGSAATLEEIVERTGLAPARIRARIKNARRRNRSLTWGDFSDAIA